MVATEKDRHRKREYILVKHGQTHMYARLMTDNRYQVMAVVGEKEGRDIVDKANAVSEFNKEVDEKVK